MIRCRYGLIAACYLAAVCWCCFAAAQEERALTLPRDTLINDLIVNRGEASNTPAESSLPPFVERVNSELRFIGRTCELTPEQQTALNEAGLDVVEKFARGLQGPGPRRRVAGAPGPAVQKLGLLAGQVVVFNGEAAQAFTPDGVLREELDAAVRMALPGEFAAKLQAERARIERQSRRCQVLILLAAIDEALLLSPQQRGQFQEYLNVNWEPLWGQFLSGSRMPRSTATPLQAAKSRGLGGVFDLPDADLERFLRPPQMAAWREMRALGIDRRALEVAVRRQRALNLQDKIGGPPMIDRQAAVQIIRNVGGGVVVVWHGNAPAAPIPAARQAAPARDGIDLNEFECLVALPAPDRAPPEAARSAAANPDGAPAGAAVVEGPAELALYLNLLIEDAASVCELSASQRETLLLAGKLDIKRYQAERQETAENLQRQFRAAGQNVRLSAATESAAINPFAYAQSRYRKSLRGRLSEDQLGRLAAACRARRERAREAMVQSLVRELDESSLLTSKQWDAVAEAVRQSLPPMTDGVTEARLHDELLFCLACLGTEGLRPLFGEDQWPAAERKLGELRQSADQAQRVKLVQ